MIPLVKITKMYVNKDKLATLAIHILDTVKTFIISLIFIDQTSPIKQKN